jgi:N-methylhydantoinase B/oxoprolinase/acetone carboxylase alpha subunit
MSIAEQMGRALQRTSVSVNIKERLDFSCALFAPDGALVANAPHLPVHLGAMSEAVKAQIKYYQGTRQCLSEKAPSASVLSERLVLCQCTQAYMQMASND